MRTICITSLLLIIYSANAAIDPSCIALTGWDWSESDDKEQVDTSTGVLADDAQIEDFYISYIKFCADWDFPSYANFLATDGSGNEYDLGSIGTETGHCKTMNLTKDDQIYLIYEWYGYVNNLNSIKITTNSGQTLQMQGSQHEEDYFQTGADIIYNLENNNSKLVGYKASINERNYMMPFDWYFYECDIPEDEPVAPSLEPTEVEESQNGIIISIVIAVLLIIIISCVCVVLKRKGKESQRNTTLQKQKEEAKDNKDEKNQEVQLQDQMKQVEYEYHDNDLKNASNDTTLQPINQVPTIMQVVSPDRPTQETTNSAMKSPYHVPIIYGEPVMLQDPIQAVQQPVEIIVDTKTQQIQTANIQNPVQVDPIKVNKF